jgi:GNAT superfamily N-acetyltransferase
MTPTFLELAASDPDPAVEAAGVALLPQAERELHVPDRHFILLDRGAAAARCSCWWTSVPSLPGQRLGVVGHYAAAGDAAAAAMLSRACEALSSAGCTIAVGPMDGNTWRRYRFVVERGAEPTFFLEPDNPDEWPAQWEKAGFVTAARYSSAMNDDLTVEDPRTEASLRRLESGGISIRTFDPGRTDEELRRIYGLSLAGFSRNFLYTPIGHAEFDAQYRAVLPFVRPELVLLAEREGELAGFIFAIPDILQGRRGHRVDTAVVKTMAVDPAASGMGLGGVLMDLVQRSARNLGFRRAIHALMHEENVSRSISARYGRTIRRYALYTRPLGAR